MLESISIIGTGFVGLVTAVCFANRGFRVYASTHDVKKAEMINRGITPFYEPKLQPLLKSPIENYEEGVKAYVTEVLANGEGLASSRGGAQASSKSYQTGAKSMSSIFLLKPLGWFRFRNVRLSFSSTI
jgi:hypothetical protein